MFSILWEFNNFLFSADRWCCVYLLCFFVIKK